MATTDPETIGRYRIIERVGRGGMGVLFRGVDPVLDREVAIKLMLVNFSEDEAEMRPRFYREARAAAKLQHRNIVTVFEFAEEGNTPYIVMEFLRGTSLASRMSSPPPLSVENKLDIVAQLCDALGYAHEQGVVHRDVKPANVFLLSDGSVKLLDFGIAKVTSSTLTRQGDVLGSASYMSPEQVTGSDAVDGRSDVFSAGVVLYELLAGRKPFHAEASTAIIMKILYEPPPPLDSLIPGLPASLVAAVARAVAKKQDDRFPTASDLGQELRAIRQAMHTGGGSAGRQQDDTRFASLTDIRTFQEALDRTPSTMSGSRTGAAGIAGLGGRKWLVPAGIGGLVVAAAIVAAVMIGRGSSAPSTAEPTASRAQAPTVPPAPLPAAPTSLQVSSDPAGAAIALDGRDTKLTTPASIAVSGAGPHRLRLSKRGFASQDVKLADADVSRGTVRYALQPAEAATIPVSIASTYPVEVWNGSKPVSSASESHQLNLPAGTTLHVKAPQYLLDATLKAEGKALDYQAPALGYVTVLTKYETCSVKIGSNDLGYPPITRLPVVVGQYRIDIACPNGQNPPSQLVTVTANSTATARIF